MSILYRATVVALRKDEPLLPRFITRFGSVLSAAWMVGGLYFMIRIDSVFNGGFYFSLHHLWLPVLLLILGYAWTYRDYYYRRNRRGLFWFMAALSYPLLLLFSWPYVMAINAVTGKNETLVIEGPVKHKWISHGKTKGYQLVIADLHSREDVTLSVPCSTYQHTALGHPMKETFFVGGFGIPYRWKH